MTDNTVFTRAGLIDLLRSDGVDPALIDEMAATAASPLDDGTLTAAANRNDPIYLLGSMVGLLAGIAAEPLLHRHPDTLPAVILAGAFAFIYADAAAVYIDKD